jgi:tetratricopeptide (TPR) repeat protein
VRVFLFFVAAVLRAAAQQNDDLDAVSKLTNEASELQRAGRQHDALALLNQARHHLAIVGPSTASQTQRLSLRMDIVGAAALSHLGRFSEAEFILRAATMASQAGGTPEDILSATGTRNLGITLLRAGKSAEAEPILALALKQFQSASQTPKEAILAAGVLGEAYRQNGKVDAAEQILRRAAHDAERVFGDRASETGIVLGYLARVQYDENSIDLARRNWRRSLNICETLRGTTHVECIPLLIDLGEASRFIKNFKEATSYLSTAIERLEAARQDPVLLASALNHLGRTWSDQGECKRAIPLFRRSLTLTEAQLGAINLRNVPATGNLANCLSRSRDWSAADALYRRAIYILEYQRPRRDTVLRELLADYTHMLQKSGRKEEARAIARRSAQIGVDARAIPRGTATVSSKELEPEPAK